MKETKNRKGSFKSDWGDLFEDSDSSDDEDVGPFKTPEDADDPIPITVSRCHTNDRRKTTFTVDNDPQYSLFRDSFDTSLFMFQGDLSPGFPLPKYFDQNKLKGFRMRSSSTQYPFDGRKERIVYDGKDICLVSIVFWLL